MKHTFIATLLAATIALPAYAADYTIIAPAAPGGGWDQTARSLQTALQQEKIAGNVQVQNVPGAGGTIGLAQFSSQAAGNPNSLIVGGYVMNELARNRLVAGFIFVQREGRNAKRCGSVSKCIAIVRREALPAGWHDPPPARACCGEWKTRATDRSASRRRAR